TWCHGCKHTKRTEKELVMRFPKKNQEEWHEYACSSTMTHLLSVAESITSLTPNALLPFLLRHILLMLMFPCKVFLSFIGMFPLGDIASGSQGETEKEWQRRNERGPIQRDDWAQSAEDADSRGMAFN
ncbi:hypothetical protein AMECASPLE_031409, partial [Ameca splendens]